MTYLQIPVQVSRLIIAAPVSPLLTVLAMQIIVVVLGTFLVPTAILAIIVPIFVPAIEAVGLDPMWFGILLIINMEIAALTPPVGINLYMLKGIAPANVRMDQCVRGILPFIGLYAVTLLLVMFFPQLAQWLPQLMKGP
jgi:TRAP-type C4-dicarboxylate transport system permease large subunit